jgi:hypothetical protein
MHFPSKEQIDTLAKKYGSESFMKTRVCKEEEGGKER